MTRPPCAGALTAAAISLCLALTACAGQPADEAAAATPAPAPSTDSAPGTAPVDPLDSVTTVVARPESLELRDANGAVVANVDYLSDAAAAIATMTTVFGAPPVDEELPASGSEPPSTAHRWGGFELLEPRHADLREPDAAASSGWTPTLFRPSFEVAMTAATWGDVSLTTGEGHAVGDAWADFIASPGVDTSGLCLELHAESVVAPMTYSDGTVRDVEFAIEFRASDDESVIGRVAGPAEVHLDGCA